jgi:5-formyltetrahydrofolate cyclo-ligase
MDSDPKKSLRKRMKALLAGMGAEDAARLSQRAAGHFRALPGYAMADIVLAFLSMPGEIGTEALVEAAMADGKVVAVPRMERSPGEGDRIVFVPLPRDYRSWPLDRYGIPEPPAEVRALEPRELGAARVIVATPGLAFDRRGGRLGRGKGYYDRFLAGARADAAREGGSLVACGLCFALQLVDEVPTGEGDQRVDLVVTEDGEA